MNKEEAWNKFKKTGCIADYLGYKQFERIGIIKSVVLSYKDIDSNINVPAKNIKFETFVDELENVYGYLVFDITKIELLNMTHSYLTNVNNLSEISIILEKEPTDIFEVIWSTKFAKMANDTYITMFCAKLL